MVRDDAAWGQLPREVRELLRAYLKQVSKVLGANLEAVILYGSAARGEFQLGRSNFNFLFILKTPDASSLAQYAPIHARWSKEGIVVPLFLTEQELEAIVETFPLEYFELSHCRILLSGRDPFPRLPVEPSRLGMQCLQEISGNLVRMRQRFIEGGGTTEVIQVLLPLSITAVLPSLRAIAHLLGPDVPSTTDALLKDLPAQLGIEGGPLMETWHLKCGQISPGEAELPRLLDRYLESLRVLSEKAAEAITHRCP